MTKLQDLETAAQNKLICELQNRTEIRKVGTEHQTVFQTQFDVPKFALGTLVGGIARPRFSRIWGTTLTDISPWPSRSCALKSRLTSATCEACRLNCQVKIRAVIQISQENCCLKCICYEQFLFNVIKPLVSVYKTTHIVFEVNENQNILSVKSEIKPIWKCSLDQ